MLSDDAADATLVIDVGGQTIKLALGAAGPRVVLPSGADLTPELLLQRVQLATQGWPFARASIGCPGPVRDNRLLGPPVNLGPGWVGEDLVGRFPVPARLVNDAVMQALGSFAGGKMLFLGFGTGLGAALVTEAAVLALELAHLPYRDGLTFEDWVGVAGRARLGHAAWQDAARDVIQRLQAAMVADETVIGGGNAVLLDALPPTVRRGHNERAVLGGLRLWQRPVTIY